MRNYNWTPSQFERYDLVKPFNTERCGVLPPLPKQTVVQWEWVFTRRVFLLFSSHLPLRVTSRVREVNEKSVFVLVSQACSWPRAVVLYIFCSLSSSSPFLWIFLAVELVLLCAGTPRTCAAPTPPPLLSRAARCAEVSACACTHSAICLSVCI